METEKKVSPPPKAGIMHSTENERGLLLGLLTEAKACGFAKVVVEIHQGKMTSAEVVHKYKFS